MYHNVSMNLEHIPFETSTKTYSQWHFEELTLRGFLATSNRGMSSWFTAQYSIAEKRADEIFNPEIHGESLPYDLFWEETGIDPNSYWWQLSAAAVKDACALFEVFLEQSANEILKRHGSSLKAMGTENSWKTHECDAFYENYLGLTARPQAIKDIVWMRNKLTHLRDELRTEAGIKDFEKKLGQLGISGEPSEEEATLGLVAHEPYFVSGVHLTQLQTWRILNLLRSHINSLGQALHAFEYGAKTTSFLDAVASGAPQDVKSFSAKQHLA